MDPFFFSSRRRHTRLTCDWSSDVCSSDLERELVLDVGHAMCDSAARRAAEAERDRVELLRKYPYTRQIHYLSGIMLLASDSDKALEEWNAELAISPEHPQALVR